MGPREIGEIVGKLGFFEIWVSMVRNLCLDSVKGVLDLARLGGFGFGEGDELGLRDELVFV